MKPVRVGDRGPAVEDIQRRLRTLGYDLGPTGVDGVFFGKTADAVLEFRLDRGLSEDTRVDDATWAAMVDATFVLGDRIIFLRAPFFHGDDIRVLQEALNSLGFACGESDGIFGAFSENAVRTFQRNAGLVSDGIVGRETVTSLNALRHVWQGKEPRSHSAAVVSPARACEGLVRTALALTGLDSSGQSVAERVANLAMATNSSSQVVVVKPGQTVPPEAPTLILLCGHGVADNVPGRPVASGLDDAGFEAKLLVALRAATGQPQTVVVELGGSPAMSEHEYQRCAVRLLDALCRAFD